MGMCSIDLHKFSTERGKRRSALHGLPSAANPPNLLPRGLVSCVTVAMMPYMATRIIFHCYCLIKLYQYAQCFTIPYVRHANT